MVRKTLPEPDACVSAEGEAGKGEHGVRVERSDNAPTLFLRTVPLPGPRLHIST
jgi:hypothetical protein